MFLFELTSIIDPFKVFSTHLPDLFVVDFLEIQGKLQVVDSLDLSERNDCEVPLKIAAEYFFLLISHDNAGDLLF